MLALFYTAWADLHIFSSGYAKTSSVDHVDCPRFLCSHVLQERGLGWISRSVYLSRKNYFVRNAESAGLRGNCHATGRMSTVFSSGGVLILTCWPGFRCCSGTISFSTFHRRCGNGPSRKICNRIAVECATGDPVIECLISLSLCCFK